MQIKKLALAALMLFVIAGVAGSLGFLSSTPPDNQAKQAAPIQNVAKQQEPKRIDLPIEVAGKPGLDAFGDPLPPGALARLGTVRFRHGLGVSIIAFSADGKKLIFGGGGGVDNAIRIVETDTGKELKTFDLNPSEMPETLGLSPDGKLLAVSWSNPNTIQGAIVVWDIATAKELAVIDCGGSSGGLVFSPDSKVLVAVDVNRRLQAWDMPTGKKLHDFTDVEGRAGQPTFSPDGKLLSFTTFLQNRAEPIKGFLYDTATWRPVQPLQAKPLTLKNLPENLVFSPDGKSLVGSDDLGHVSFRDALTGELIERVKVTIQVTPTPIRSMSFSHDSKLLAVVNDGVTIWDVATRKLLHTLKGARTVAVFSPRELLLVTSGGPWGTVSQGGSPALRFWDPVTGKELVKIDAPSAAVQVTYWLPEGKLLAVSPAEDSYRLWDWRSGKQLAKVSTGVTYIWWPAICPNGKFLAVSQWRGQKGDDETIHLFDLLSGKEIHRVGPKDGSIPIGFTYDGRLLISREVGNIVAVWDTATGKLSRRIDLKEELKPAFIWRAAISGDGKSLALEVAEILPVKPDPNDIDPGGRVPPCGYYRCVIDLATGKKRWHTDLDGSKMVDALTFSPDGKILAEGFGQAIHLRDSASGSLLRVLETQKEWRRWVRQPGALAITPDGKMLIAADDRSNIYVWDIATGKELQKFTGHRGRIFSISVSSDSRKLATASEDSTVLLWNLGGG